LFDAVTDRERLVPIPVEKDQAPHLRHTGDGQHPVRPGVAAGPDHGTRDQHPRPTAHDDVGGHQFTRNPTRSNRPDESRIKTFPKFGFAFSGTWVTEPAVVSARVGSTRYTAWSTSPTSDSRRFTASTVRVR